VPRYLRKSEAWWKGYNSAIEFYLRMDPSANANPFEVPPWEERPPEFEQWRKGFEQGYRDA